MKDLYTNLPHQIIETINNIQFRFHNYIDDVFIWSHNKNGVYTTKSCFHWLLSHAEQVPNINLSHFWSWIWKLKILEKYKFLVWPACHDVVSTLSFLHHRNMALSAVCPRCGNHEETFLHCIRVCTFSTKFRHHIGFNNPDFFMVKIWFDEF